MIGYQEIRFNRVCNDDEVMFVIATRGRFD
jgi:hypothetical protein